MTSPPTHCLFCNYKLKFGIFATKDGSCIDQSHELYYSDYEKNSFLYFEETNLFHNFFIVTNNYQLIHCSSDLFIEKKYDSNTFLKFKTPDMTCVLNCSFLNEKNYSDLKEYYKLLQNYTILK